jgi:hypothetical protein
MISAVAQTVVIREQRRRKKQPMKLSATAEEAVADVQVEI